MNGIFYFVKNIIDVVIVIENISHEQISCTFAALNTMQYFMAPKTYLLQFSHGNVPTDFSQSVEG